MSINSIGNTLVAPTLSQPTPGGSSGQLQYNDAGAFGGCSGATWDGVALNFASGAFLKYNAVPWLHSSGDISNSFFGWNSGNTTITGTWNTIIGNGAGSSVTTAFGNTALGHGALAAATTGGGNIAIGVGAMSAVTTAWGSIGIGNSALAVNESGGEQNIAIGHSALSSNTSGFGNVAFGMTALASSTTGYFNIGMGTNSLLLNTTGYSNVAVGHNCQLATTTGFENVGIGSNALTSNTVGSCNTAIGQEAMEFTLTASWNTAIGVVALANNRSGSRNVAVGSMSSGYAGSNNTASGFGALNFCSGYNNVGEGHQSLFDLGAPVAAVALIAARSYVIVSVGTTDFTLVGAPDNIVGTIFTASGVGTGTGTASAADTSCNTAIGANTGRGITSGSNNTIIGAQVMGLAEGLTGAVIIASGDGAIHYDYNKTIAGVHTFDAPVISRVLTVATLPVASASMTGARSFVGDANATMSIGIGAIVAGGGSNRVPVYCDGTNWRIG
jgi:hypothetical protein